MLYFLLYVVEAGGKLLSYKKHRKNIEVDWEVEGVRMNSLIDPVTFQCQEAGFCVSGQDKRLRIDAAVLTAKEHIEGKYLVETRHR